jgi:microcystin-dependent protein
MGISNASNGLRPGVCTSTTRPTAPYLGQLIFETDTFNILFWNGSAWQGAISAPAGTVNPFAGSSAPSGWLLCDGRSTGISRTTYAGLFAVIGTTYGTGDGSTTFNLPDLRGRVIAGVDNMGGTDAGRLSTSNTLGTASGSETNTHNHFQSIGNDSSVWYIKNFGDQPRSQVVTANRATPNFVTNASAAGRFDSTDNETINIMQPTMVLNYIIKV